MSEDGHAENEAYGCIVERVENERN